MNEVIILKLIKKGEKTVPIQLSLFDYVTLDSFLQNVSNHLYEDCHTSEQVNNFLQQDFEAFLSSYGFLIQLPSSTDEDVHIIYDLNKKELLFNQMINENTDANNEPANMSADENNNINLTEYKLFLKHLNEFRYTSRLTPTRVDRIARRFHKIFTECEMLMYYFFEEYPNITESEVYITIKNGVQNHEEWLYDAISFVEQYVDTIKNDFKPDNGRIYINVPMEMLEKENAIKKGAFWDEKLFSYYYTDADDAYKFGTWLPVIININEKSNKTIIDEKNKISNSNEIENIKYIK